MSCSSLLGVLVVQFFRRQNVDACHIYAHHSASRVVRSTASRWCLRQDSNLHTQAYLACALAEYKAASLPLSYGGVSFLRGEPEEIRTPAPLAGRLLSRQAQLTTLPLALCACGGSPRIRTEKRDVLSVPGMPVPVNDPLRVVLRVRLQLTISPIPTECFSHLS